MVEMSGLFSHEPMSRHAREVFERYCMRQRKNNVYDFEMGDKLERLVRHCGLTVLHAENMYDPELTFDGPADPAILGAWENRLGRMKEFNKFLGDEEFNGIKNEFLDCLSDKDHKSRTTVNFIVATM